MPKSLIPVEKYNWLTRYIFQANPPFSLQEDSGIGDSLEE